jgi:hypothetical protein
MVEERLKIADEGGRAGAVRVEGQASAALVVGDGAVMAAELGDLLPPADAVDAAPWTKITGKPLPCSSW